MGTKLCCQSALSLHAVRSQPQSPCQQQRRPAEHQGIGNIVDRVRHLGGITSNGQNRQVKEYREQRHQHTDPASGTGRLDVDEQCRSRQ